MLQELFQKEQKSMLPPHSTSISEPPSLKRKSPDSPFYTLPSISEMKAIGNQNDVQLRKKQIIEKELNNWWNIEEGITEGDSLVWWEKNWVT